MSKNNILLMSCYSNFRGVLVSFVVFNKVSHKSTSWCFIIVRYIMIGGQLDLKKTLRQLVFLHSLLQVKLDNVSRMSSNK
jgi:hypothetical protein